MARGVNIPIAADASGVIREGKKVEDSLEKVIDSLDDVGDASKDAAKVSEKALDGIADEAEDSADRLAKTYRESFKEVDKASKSTDIGTNIKKGTKEAEEGLEEFKDEASSTATEVAASFDGSAESIVGGFQEVAANAFSGFGPAGAAAGIAAAAGIGIVTGALQTAADKTNEIGEAAADLATELSAAASTEDQIALLNDRWTEFSTTIVDTKSWFELWQDSSVTAIQKLDAVSRMGLVSLTDLYDAYKDPDPVSRIDALREAEERLTEVHQNSALIGDKRAAETSLQNRLQEDRIELTANEQIAINDARSALSDEIKTQEQAIEIEQALASAKGQTIEQFRVEQETLAASQAAQESYADALRDAADPISSYEDLLADKTLKEQEAAQATADATKSTEDTWEDHAKKVKVTMSDLIGDLEDQIATNTNFQSNLDTLAKRGVGEGLINELKSQGPEVAGQVTELLANATDKELTDFVQKRSIATGETMATGIGTGVKDSQDDIKTDTQSAIDYAMSNITPPKLNIDVNGDGIIDQIGEALRNHTFGISVAPVARPGKPVQY